MSSFSNEETEAQRQVVALCPPRGTRQATFSQAGSLFTTLCASNRSSRNCPPQNHTAPLWPDGPAQAQDKALGPHIAAENCSTWSPTLLVLEQPHTEVPARPQPTSQAQATPRPRQPDLFSCLSLDPVPSGLYFQSLPHVGTPNQELHRISPAVAPEPTSTRILSVLPECRFSIRFSAVGLETCILN